MGVGMGHAGSAVGGLGGAAWAAAPDVAGAVAGWRPSRSRGGRARFRPLAAWRRWRDGAQARRDRVLLARSAVVAELVWDLPDEDFGEYLEDAVALYRYGGKPYPEEAEYLELVGDALDRVG